MVTLLPLKVRGRDANQIVVNLSGYFSITHFVLQRSYNSMDLVLWFGVVNWVSNFVAEHEIGWQDGRISHEQIGKLWNGNCLFWPSISIQFIYCVYVCRKIYLCNVNKSVGVCLCGRVNLTMIRVIPTNLFLIWETLLGI